MDILDCARRGYERSDEELPELSIYGWAMNHLDHEPDDWDEKKVHVSDYRYWLDPSEGGCDRQLYHRLRGDRRDPPTLWLRLMWDQGFGMQVRFSWLVCQGLTDGWGLESVEMDVTNGLPGRDVGSCDLVLRGEGKILGIEFKTQRGRAFQYLDGPKDSHVIQSQGELYALRKIYPDMDVEHRLVYLDREGQNEPLVFPTAWDHEVRTRVIEASLHANQIKSKITHEAPEALDPMIEVRENKGPNSIYLKEPWVCSYCDYKGPSCRGALPDDLTELGIVAKGDHNGEFEMKTERMQNQIRAAIENAAEAGNVKFK